MSDLISRTARLVPYAKRPKHLASFVTAYLYEPPADDIGAWLGNLYVVVEVLVSGRASEEVVDLIIQTAGEIYYNEPGGVTDPLARFEAAIKHVNHELSEYVGHGNAAWIGKLSAIIAVQTGKELHVAQTGSAEAFLYRGKAVSRISVTETSRPATPSKTFGSIATGELEAGDKLLIATPALIHQIPLTKLQTVISSESPNAAIAEIGQLLEGTVTNRIAAVVVEITTPELAALKVRSDEPEELQLASSNENLAEAAIRAAAPLAQSTADTSKKVAGVAVGWWQRLRPILRAGSLRAVDALRRGLAKRKGRQAALIIIITIVIFAAITITLTIASANGTKQFKAYQNLFQRYIAAQNQAATGDKTSARATLTDISAKLNKLGTSETNINSQLKNNPLLEGEPTSITGFKALISDQLDQIDGLVKIAPTTIANIGGKNTKPNHFESDGSHAYIIDAGDHNKISIVSLLAGTEKDSVADTTALGDVLATTISAGNDGMFILTSKPSVWFYRFASDTLVEQTIAYGSWPKATAIASYGPNIYLLGDNTVYKHVKNATGYSPKNDYISTTQSTSHNTSLAVDGWVYALTNTSLNRYLGSTLKQSVANPAALGRITNLRSAGGGNVLIGTSLSSNRIALWTASDTEVAFSKQIALSDGKVLYDAVYDARLGKIFATIDNRLVSLPIKF